MSFAFLMAAMVSSAAMGQLARTVIDRIRDYKQLWDSFYVEFKSTGEFRESPQLDWTLFSRNAGRFELHDNQFQYLRNSIERPIRHKDVTASFVNAISVDRGTALSVFRRYDSLDGEALAQAIGKDWLSRSAYGGPTFESVTLTAVDTDSQLAGFFPFLSVGFLDILETVPKSAWRIQDVVCGRWSCINVQLHDRSGAHSMHFAKSLGFAPIKYNHTISPGNEFHGRRLDEWRPYGKELSKFEWGWELMEPRDGAYGGTWQKRIRAVHTDRGIIEERHTVELDQLTQPVDRLSPMWAPPVNGTRVVLVEHQQISAEWYNGEIRRTYDNKAVERLAEVEFRRTSVPIVGPAVWAICVAASALAVAWLWFRLTKARRLLLLVALSPQIGIKNDALAALEPRYCGISAVYGAACAVGVCGEFVPLVDEKYISRITGSTIEDLLSAANHLGVHASAYRRLSISSLRHAAEPLVLHVASPGQLQVYNHWILYLGPEQDGVRLCDYDGEVYVASWRSLLARWDGIALAVHPGETPTVRYAAVEAAVYVCWLAVGLLAILVANMSHCMLTRILPPWLSVATWPGILLAAAGVLSVLHDQVTRDGLISSGPAGRYVAAVHDSDGFRAASFSDLSTASAGEANTVIVDARMTEDFEAGHIPTAISLPVTVSDSELVSRLRTINRNCRIIVYCQSDRCGFAKIVATRLVGAGFREIWLWQDGWNGWCTHSYVTSTD